jgi:glycosyltransferase involved in cell wall biosynthesis
MRASEPLVSVVIPALDEVTYLPRTLSSLGRQAGVPFEVIVVDGGSTDGTPAVAREFDVQLVEQSGTGIGAGRHEGAQRASGDWLAFVDADTRVLGDYLPEMLAFVREQDLAAASSRCRVIDAYRGKAKQAVVNRVFPRLPRPILPGFNFFVDAAVYEASGGFPNVPNEDTAFSRRLAREYDVGYHSDVLVETSGRRFADAGLTGALYHYVRLDVGRARADYL